MLLKLLLFLPAALLDEGMQQGCEEAEPLEDQVIVNERVIRGRVACEHVEFLGIPYAQPPTGHRRWQPPQPMDQLPHSPFDATRFGNYCWQLYSGTHSKVYDVFFHLDPKGESEDCLNLNIYVPRGKARRYPVLVFIHGGAFAMGTNQTPMNNPRDLCIRQNLLIVSINYRLGIFGFLASPRLLAEERGPIGNFGLLDQMEALRWIKRNIGAFGGDPDRITIMGQSAGAVSVHFLTILAAPLETKLFHSAILLSGTMELMTPRTLEEDNFAHQSFDVLVKRFGCENAGNLLACLRGIPAQDLVTFGKLRQWDFIWGPTVDGRLLKELPSKLSSQTPSQLPTLITTCGDEGSLFAGYQLSRGGSVREDLKRVIRDDGMRQLALEVYEKTGGPTEFEHLTQMVTDCLFVCPLRRWELRSLVGSPNWYLRIAKNLPLVSQVSKWASGYDVGSFHGLDIHILFRAFPWLLLPHTDYSLRFQSLIGDFCRTSQLHDETIRSFEQDPQEWFDDFTRKKCDLIWNRLPAPPIDMDWNADLSPPN